MRDDVRLVVCGTGSHKPSLERLAAELGVSAEVSFRGRVSDDELRRWQRTATSTVNLSAREAFGLILLEAAVAAAGWSPPTFPPIPNWRRGWDASTDG